MNNMQPINLQESLDFLYIAAGAAHLTREEHKRVDMAALQIKKFIDETLAEAKAPAKTEPKVEPKKK